MTKRLLLLLICLAIAAMAQSPGIATVTYTSSCGSQPCGTTPVLTMTAGLTIFDITLSQNITSSTFSGAASGAVILNVVENGTGGFSFTPPTNFKGFSLRSTAANYSQTAIGLYDSTTGNVVFSAPQTIVGSSAANVVLESGAVGPAPVPTVSSGTAVTLSAPRQYFTCTGTCTVTVPVPAAGNEFCVRNGAGVSTVITLSALGSSAFYEKTDNSAYGTAGTGTMVSGGAVGDKVCIVGLDSTHYQTWSFNGTWTVN